MVKRAVKKQTAETNSWSDRISQNMTVERVIIGGSLLAVILMVAAFAASSLLEDEPPELNPDIVDRSVSYVSQGADHISVGDSHAPYNSNPPTSGPHYASPLPVRVYTAGDITPDEALVHNLEHGHVWISYRDADDREAIEAAEKLHEDFPSHVVVSYRPENDTRIAASAWTRLLTQDEPDVEELTAFVLRWRSKAPEDVPG